MVLSTDSSIGKPTPVELLDVFLHCILLENELDASTSDADFMWCATNRFMQRAKTFPAQCCRVMECRNKSIVFMLVEWSCPLPALISSSPDRQSSR